MAKYRKNLPPLGSDIFACYTGMDTDLIYNRGIDLPGFASYPLLSNPGQKNILREYYSNLTGEIVEINGSYTCGENKTNGIDHIAICPDGRHVLTAISRCLVLWDIKVQNWILDFEGHTHLISDVSFRTDCRRLLSASADQTIISWDIEVGEPIQVFRGHSSGVDSATFSTDSQRILSGSSDGSIILWNAEKLQEFHGPEGHTDGIVSAGLSKDGRYGLTSDSETVIWWDAQAGHVLQKISLSSEDEFEVVIDKQGRFADSQSSDVLHLIGGPILDADLSPDGSQAALALSS